VQLVDQDQEHVELANRSETSRDLPQPAIELSRDVPGELQHRHELAQVPRRHARAVESGHVAGFERGERARETIDAAPQQKGTIDGHDSRFGQTAFIIVKA
jgi:hypothetical protein